MAGANGSIRRATRGLAILNLSRLQSGDHYASDFTAAADAIADILHALGTPEARCDAIGLAVDHANEEGARVGL